MPWSHAGVGGSTSRRRAIGTGSTDDDRARSSAIGCLARSAVLVDELKRRASHAYLTLFRAVRNILCLIHVPQGVARCVHAKWAFVAITLVTAVTDFIGFSAAGFA